MATASGTIFNYNTSDNSLAGIINLSVPNYNYVPGSNMWASADGTVLVAVEMLRRCRKRLFVAIRHAAFQHTVPSNPGFGVLAQSGTVIAGAEGSGECTEFVPATGGAPLYCVETGGLGMFAVSPDGITPWLLSMKLALVPSLPTFIRTERWSPRVPGWAFTWLDNDRLLTYQSLVKFQIYDSSGNFISDAATQPNLSQCYSNCQIVSADSVTQGNQIVNYMTGAITWESGDYQRTQKSAAAGTQMVIAAGNYVLAEPFSASGGN